MMSITKIKGLSDVRRLPRLNKIRLGIKATSDRTGGEYPEETPYFVCPPEVVKIYGDKPTELDVMLPIEDTDICLPQAYEWYGNTAGLKCRGDGEIAFRADPKTHAFAERECPCEMLDVANGCKQRMHLRVILHKVNVGGVYQIDTSSINSIIDINSSIFYVRALVGRVALVPLKLKRRLMETHHLGKKQIHYPMIFELEADVTLLNSLRESTGRILESCKQYSLPAPVTENPALDADVIIPHLKDTLKSRFETATTKAELNEIAKELTPEVKATMLASDVALLKEVYGKRLEILEGK